MLRRPGVWLGTLALASCFVHSDDLAQAQGFLSFADTPVVSVSSSNVGYLDNAIVGTQFRLRVDAAYGADRPARAEYFYPKPGSFANPFNLPGLQAALEAVGEFDPAAPGPPGKPDPPPLGRPAETNIDYQDIRAYFEYAATNRFSGFVEVPVRFLNPEVNNNASGLADVEAGFKYALYADEERYVTFQLRTYVPTGDPFLGLGTNHVSLEPALLFYYQITDAVALEGDFRDWIPIAGTDFAGNIVRYGIGLSYDLFGEVACGGCCDDARCPESRWRQLPRIVPVVELAGWTVLDGREAARPSPSEDAAGDTIVNVKIGARIELGRGDLYLGYGRALTGDIWYHDIMRLEYRQSF